MFILSAMLTTALNRTLNGELLRFANHHIALAAVGQRWVWRINTAGKLQPANALIDGDCQLHWQNGHLHISGSGELLRVLSELAQQTDWLVVVSNVFGSRLAPAVLYGLEQGSSVFKRRISNCTATPAQTAIYTNGINALYKRVQQLDKKVSALVATKGQ